MMQPNSFLFISSRMLSRVVTPPDAMTGSETAAANSASAFEVRPAEHAVAGDVGVDDRVERPVAELARHVEDRHLGRFQPAVRCDFAVAGVEAEHDLLRVCLGHLPHPHRVLQSARTEHDAGDADVQRRLDIGLRAQSAADLARDVDRLDDATDDRPVDRAAGLGPVEIDEV